METVVIGIGGLVEKIMEAGDLSDAKLAALIRDPRNNEPVNPASIYRWRLGLRRPRRWALRALVELAKKHGIKVESAAARPTGRRSR